MDRSLARSELTTHPAPFRYGLATEADDAGLRQLLRETPLPGRVQITLEREPSFLAAARLEAERSYTICARDRETGRLFAMASRSVHTRYVNGEPQRVGYLSQLRIAASHRHLSRSLLRRGFALLRETHAADEAPFDITTIVAGNDVAKRVLEAGWPGLPRYTAAETILTFLIPVGNTVTPGGAQGPRQPERAMETVRFAANGTPGSQWQPALGKRGLRYPVLAEDGASLDRRGASCSPTESYRQADCGHQNDRMQFSLVQPCPGPVWDQRSFKQIVVRGYSPWVRRCRWMLRLPPVGTVLPVAYLTQPAPRLDEVDAARERARRMGCRWLAFGLAARHPLVPVLGRRYRPRVYESRLYVVHEPGARPALDGRIPQIEVALL